MRGVHELLDRVLPRRFVLFAGIPFVMIALLVTLGLCCVIVVCAWTN